MEAASFMANPASSVDTDIKRQGGSTQDPRAAALKGGGSTEGGQSSYCAAHVMADGK
jgi:hypothetical protein